MTSRRWLVECRVFGRPRGGHELVEDAAEDWELTVTDGVSTRTYDWDAFHALPQTSITVDIHCVTRWSKLDTTWEGVSVEVLLDSADVGDHEYALVTSYGD